MNKKDRRIRLFLLTGLYIIGFQIVGLYSGTLPGNLFEFSNGSIPVFDVFISFFTGLASFIACWTLWARASWSAGWSMFTLGLLLYGAGYSKSPGIGHTYGYYFTYCDAKFSLSH